jgi:raffinose/stachyose/melibiose transport system permease protein
MTTLPQAVRRGDGLGKYVVLVFLSALLAVMFFPFLIVLINAFKTPAEYAGGGPLSLPHGLSLAGITEFWSRVNFTNKLLNSALISLAVAVAGVLLSLLNAFALGIGRVRGRIGLLVFFLIANTLPQESLAYPLYYFAKALKIYDTQLAVIIVFSVIQSAFGTYLLSSVFSTFPKELIEAAQIDGCNKLQLLLWVVLPASMPTLAVLFTFFFIWTWNEFFLPLILLISNARQTVPLAIAILQGQHNMDATTSSASALLGILPCILFFLVFQRTLTRGVMAGSIK